MIWLQLFYVYLKIGIFGFGGGYAMLSLIQWTATDGFRHRNLRISSPSRR
jgi:chromate transporter